VLKVARRQLAGKQLGSPPEPVDSVARNPEYDWPVEFPAGGGKKVQGG
jgi:hypothetical protein